MSTTEFSALRTVFHEPNRLAIVAALAARPKGMGFVDLGAEVSLTNGNLSRHLKALEADGVVCQEKSFKGVKPHTQIALTECGRDRFAAYLRDLERVLAVAHESLTEDADELAAAKA